MNAALHVAATVILSLLHADVTATIGSRRLTLERTAPAATRSVWSALPTLTVRNCTMLGSLAQLVIATAELRSALNGIDSIGRNATDVVLVDHTEG